METNRLAALARNFRASSHLTKVQDQLPGLSAKVLEQQRQQENERLYNSTLDRFERSSAWLSKLDGSTEVHRQDTDSKPGDVNVDRVGSLRKTAEGLSMQLIGPMGSSVSAVAAAYYGETVGVPGMINFRTFTRQKEVFTVDEAKNTISYQQYRSVTSDAWQGAVERDTLLQSYTLDRNTKEITGDKLLPPRLDILNAEHQWVGKGITDSSKPIPLGFSTAWGS